MTQYINHINQYIKIKENIFNRTLYMQNYNQLIINYLKIQNSHKNFTRTASIDKYIKMPSF